MMRIYLSHIKHVKRFFLTYAIPATLISIVVGAYLWNVSRLPMKLEVYIFDTKGKPSFFIRTPDDERIIIDGGANSEILRHLTAILPFYSRRIDTVILTIDDGIDASGLIDVIGRYKIGSIIIPGINANEAGISSSTDQIYETFMDTANKLQIPIREAVRGDKIDLADGLSAEILFPAPIITQAISSSASSTTGFKYSKSSPPEMVMKINYGDTSLLLLGGIGLKAQKFLVNATSSTSIDYTADMTSTIQMPDPISDLTSNVLIVPHSISASSLASELINAVRPSFIVYSQSATKNSTSKAVSKSAATKKSSTAKVDPLYMIHDDHRFNLKQKSTIEVLSDGKSVEII